MTEIKIGTWVQVTDPAPSRWRSGDIFKVVELDRIGNICLLWGYLPPARVTQHGARACIGSACVKPWRPQQGDTVLVRGHFYQVLGPVPPVGGWGTGPTEYLLERDCWTRTVPLEDILPWATATTLLAQVPTDLAPAPQQEAPPTARTLYSQYSAMITCWCGEAVYVGAGVARDTLAPTCAAGHNPYTMDTPKPEVSRRCIHGEYVWAAMGEGLRAVHPLQEGAITEWERLWRTRALKRG